MNAFYAALIVSFVLGALGYIIAVFFIKPILKYRKIKKTAVLGIRSYINTIYNEDEDVAVRRLIKERAQQIREHSIILTECYENGLPNWYKILLKNRSESPIDAAQHMMVLANTRTYDHGLSRIEKIKQTLRI